MLRKVLLLSLVCLHANFAYGMDCSLGTSRNILEELVQTCPLPFQSSSKSYCCYDLEKETHYCCDLEEFTLKTGMGIILPMVFGIAIIASLIVFCVSCLCCSCCPWYRGRRQGTIYGKVQAPSVVHVIQSTNPSAGQPIQTAQNYPPVYPTSVTGMPQSPPPQYSNVAYAQQAPYNPNYQ